MTASSWNYTRDELRAAIRAVGIAAGDVISLQVSLGRLGVPKDTPSTFGAIANLVLDTFTEVLGPGGTIIVPTYTYSIGRGEVFDVESTPSGIGEFPELFRRRPGAIRSRDPMLSSAGIGPRAEEIIRNISRSCYGEGSTYHRLRDVNAKICTLGLGLYWATFRHHIEEAAAVPFRFRKVFHGVVREHGVESRESWVYFAAPLVDCCAPMGIPLEEKARAAGLLRVAPIGRSEIAAIGAREYFDFGLEALRRDPWLTAKGPACDFRQLVALEDARVGAEKPVVTLRADSTPFEMLEALWRLRRDVISDGYDAALEGLADIVPITVHEYPSGSQAGPFIVPEKWTCRHASLQTLAGAAVFSSSENPLHVASYSHPFDGVVSRDELLRHLHVHPRVAAATPYHTLIDTRDWGLCCSEQVRSSLNDEQYRVLIDVAFSYGTLKVGEVIVPGDTEDAILLCAHLDHPAQANDGLSGVVVAIDLMRQLAASRSRRFTWRLLIVPGTIGLAAYADRHPGRLARVRGALFLDMLGLDEPIAQQPWLFELEGRAVPFRPETPVVRVSRAARSNAAQRGGAFGAYHSDLDTPALVTPARLAEAAEAALTIGEAFEQAATASAVTGELR